MTQGRMASAGTSETSSIDHQRLCWAMRCAERGGDNQFMGAEWLGNIVKFDQYRSLLEWAVRCLGCGRDVSPAVGIPRMQDGPVLFVGLFGNPSVGLPNSLRLQRGARNVHWLAQGATV
jgi:hypothetical protein